jgi:hypothetical protein
LKLQKRHENYYGYLKCLTTKVAEKPELSSCAPLAGFLEKMKHLMSATKKDVLVSNLTSADNIRVTDDFISWLLGASQACRELHRDHNDVVLMLKSRGYVSLLQK